MKSFKGCKLSRFITFLGLSVALIAPQIAYSQTIEEEPTALAMAGDLLIARPLLITATVAGALLYIVSLPLSLAGGNAAEAGDTLVVGPAKAAFVRCLGCTHSGYKKEIANLDE
jgi:hypothetical protein